MLAGTIEHVMLVLSDKAPKSSVAEKLTFLGIAALLVCMAGMMSGLTLGLMSLSKVDVQMLIETGTPREKLYAARIMPLISNPHFLLCTLLLGNALAMEGLPLVLNKVVDPVTAIILSITVVLIAGEIVPQAICTRYGLAVGGISAPFVKAIRLLFSPVAWPIGKLLDLLVGHDDGALFRRPQLKALVDMHGTHSGLGGTLQHDEVLVIQGALDLVHKTAIESMTPLDKVFMLCTDDVLNEDTLRRVMASGHSRIPVYQHPNRLHVVGLIITKELARFNPADCIPVSDVRMRSLPHLPCDMPLFDLLDLFQIGRSHMAVLCKPDVPFDHNFEEEERGAGHSLPPSPTSSQASRPHGSIQITIPPATQLARGSPGAPGGPQGPELERGSATSEGAHPSAAGSSLGGTGAGSSPPLGGPSPPLRGASPPLGTGLPPRAKAATLAPANATPPVSHTEEQAAAFQEDFWELQGEPVGIITLEDVIEELLHTEIIDETDRFVDNEQTQRVNVGLLVKKLPLKLRQHLSAETLLPVLEQTKAAISLARANPSPAPGAHLAPSPAFASTSALPQAPIARTKSWTSPYSNGGRPLRSPRDKTSSSSSPNLQQHQRLRATQSEGDEAPSPPLASPRASLDLQQESGSRQQQEQQQQRDPQQPFVRRKVSFKLPLQGLLGGGHQGAQAAGQEGSGAAAEGAAASPFASATGIASAAVAAALGGLQSLAAAGEGQTAGGLGTSLLKNDHLSPEQQ